MKCLLPIACFAALCLLARPLAAQTLCAEAQLVSGTVAIKFNAKDNPRPLRAAPERTPIWVGAFLIGGEKGGKVIVFETGKQPREVDIAPSEKAVPFPLSKEPRVLKIVGNLEGLMTGIGGNLRSGESFLYAPADDSRALPGVPVKFRWEKKPAGTQVHFAVFVRGERKAPIWEESVPGDKGVWESASLGTRLAEQQRAGTNVFTIRTTIDGKTRPEEAKLTLLDADEQKELTDDLRACDQAEAGPLRLLLHAAVYHRFEMFEASIATLDRLLADREQGARPDIVQAARQLALFVGDQPGATRLSAAQ